MAHSPPCQPQTRPDAFPRMLFQRSWCTISRQKIIVFVRIIVQFVRSPENDFLPAPDSGDVSDVLSTKASVWISRGRVIIQGRKANGELLLLPGGILWLSYTEVTCFIQLSPVRVSAPLPPPSPWILSTFSSARSAAPRYKAEACLGCRGHGRLHSAPYAPALGSCALVARSSVSSL